MERDPLQEMEAVVAEEALRFEAEQIERHGQILLFTACQGKPFLHGQLIFEAMHESNAYIATLLVGVGLTARNWCRVMAGDGKLDLRQYLNPHAEDTPDDRFAHRLLAAVLGMEDAMESATIAGELKGFHEKHPPEIWGKMIVHYIGLCAELTNEVSNVRNGDYRQEQDGGS